MKDTLKIVELLEENIDRITENGIYEIERDLLLERLRGIYASVVAVEAVAEEERVLDALIGIGAAMGSEESEPEIEVERIYDDEPAEVPAEEVEESLEEPLPEPEIEEEPVEELIEESAEELAEEPVAEEEEPIEEPVEEVAPVPEEDPTEEVVEESIEEEEPLEEEIDHEALLALYDDEEDEEEIQVVAPEEVIAEPTVEEAVGDANPEEEFVVVDEIVAEPEIEMENKEETEEDMGNYVFDDMPAKVVLGDVLSVEQTTVAENLVEQSVVDVATAAGASLSLRESIGMNDKYILMRDLFAGDGEYYERALKELDSFESLDEAMLYIYDNFHWNPNSEGARLLMELLARKLF